MLILVRERKINVLSLSYTLIEVDFGPPISGEQIRGRGERGACGSVEGTQGADSRS